MEINCYHSASGVEYPASSSKTKLAHSCNFIQDADLNYQNKLEQDIQSTHQNYVKIEQENGGIKLQIENFENMLNDQSYQYTCLKYELELLNRQKHDLQSELNETKAPNNEQFQMQRVPEGEAVSNIKSVNDNVTYDYSHLRKLPEKVCECGAEFKKRKFLKRHIQYYSNKEKFSCKICGIQKHGFNLLKCHMKLEHNVQGSFSVKVCGKCGKLFNKVEDLHAHQRREHGRKTREENVT